MLEVEPIGQHCRTTPEVTETATPPARSGSIRRMAALSLCPRRTATVVLP